MVQVFDYKECKKINFDDISHLCYELNLNRSNVIKAISRETKVLKRYLISYGVLDNQLILDKKPITYAITDLKTGNTENYNSFKDLVVFANKILNAKYPESRYHKNMSRNYISYNRFKITKNK